MNRIHESNPTDQASLRTTTSTQIHHLVDQLEHVQQVIQQVDVETTQILHRIKQEQAQYQDDIANAKEELGEIERQVTLAKQEWRDWTAKSAAKPDTTEQVEAQESTAVFDTSPDHEKTTETMPTSFVELCNSGDDDDSENGNKAMPTETEGKFAEEEGNETLTPMMVETKTTLVTTTDDNKSVVETSKEELPQDNPSQEDFKQSNPLMVAGSKVEKQDETNMDVEEAFQTDDDDDVNENRNQTESGVDVPLGSDSQDSTGCDEKNNFSETNNKESPPQLDKNPVESTVLNDDTDIEQVQETPMDVEAIPETNENDNHDGNSATYMAANVPPNNDCKKAADPFVSDDVSVASTQHSIASMPLLDNNDTQEQGGKEDVAAFTEHSAEKEVHTTRAPSVLSVQSCPAPSLDHHLSSTTPREVHKKNSRHLVRRRRSSIVSPKKWRRMVRTHRLQSIWTGN